MTTIGDRLETILAETGLSGAELAKRTRKVVSQAAVSKIKTGKTEDPGVFTLQAIAKASGYSLMWLITGKGDKKSDKDWSVVDEGQLTPSQEEALLAGIRHSLIQRGLNPNRAEFHAAVSAAFDDAKADLLARQRGTG